MGDEGTRRLLKGFTMGNIKVHLLSDDLQKLYTKAKYRDLFDIGILSMHSSISEDMNVLFKKKAKIHVETVDNLCSISKEARAKYREDVTAKCQKSDWF